MGRSSALQFLLLGLFATVFNLNPVSALGSQCTVPLGSGSAAAGDPYWLQSVKHQGISAFNPSPSSYQVFRNVKVLFNATISKFRNSHAYPFRILVPRVTE